MRPRAFLFFFTSLVGSLLTVPSAQAVVGADSVLCKLPYAPGQAGTALPRPRLVMVEGVRSARPRVSFYGHQILDLPARRQGSSTTVSLDSPQSRYFFKLDTARGRLVVALKSEGNSQGRAPRENEGVAGDCSPL